MTASLVLSLAQCLDRALAMTPEWCVSGDEVPSAGAPAWGWRMRAPALLVLLLAATSSLGLSQNVSGGRPAQRPEEAYQFVVERADVPMYPIVARMARLEGTVRITATIAHGDVVKAEASSTASSVLKVAATRNLETWKFAPEANGQLTVTYVYALAKEEDFPPPNPSVEIRFPSYVRVTSVPAKPKTLY